MTRHTGRTSVSELFATEVDLPAPAEEVFRHLTDPAAMVRWMGQHATLRPVPGGAFEIDINGVPVRGRYLEIDPPRIHPRHRLAALPGPARPGRRGPGPRPRSLHQAPGPSH
jgi:Activator of Hsp90 ATPase homolog 1-like protein